MAIHRLIAASVRFGTLLLALVAPLSQCSGRDLLTCRWRRFGVPDFVDLSLTALHDRYASRRARPSDVIAAIYDRIEAGSAQPSWIHVRPRGDALLACAEIEARRGAGEQLPLYGVPFGVKDNIDVAGMPTTVA